MLEAIELQQNDFVLSAAQSIHNVLLMITIEQVTRNVAGQVLDWVIGKVLPLGTPPGLKFSMTSKYYIESSAYLNLMVYQNSTRRRSHLSWTQRVKVMSHLIRGMNELRCILCNAP